MIQLIGSADEEKELMSTEDKKETQANGTDTKHKDYTKH